MLDIVGQIFSLSFNTFCSFGGILTVFSPFYFSVGHTAFHGILSYLCIRTLSHSLILSCLHAVKVVAPLPAQSVILLFFYHTEVCLKTAPLLMASLAFLFLCAYIFISSFYWGLSQEMTNWPYVFVFNRSPKQGL